MAQLRSLGGAAGDAVAQLSAQLLKLSALQKQIASADPMELPAIRGQIALAVAGAQGVAQQASAGASTSKSAQFGLTEACEKARATTNDFVRDFYDHHEFDRYLEFTSAEDREEYRHREQERREAIERAQALHTPEGDLLANKLAIEQLKDAGGHGADRSPDYAPAMKKLLGSQHTLASAIEHSPEADRAARREAAVDSASPALPQDVLAGLKNVGITGAGQPDGPGVAARDDKSAVRSPH